MENKQIKELMTAMERSGLTKVQIKKGTFELTLERAITSPARAPSTVEVEEEAPLKVVPSKGHAPLPRTTDMAAALQKEASGKYITSPMVGTFYPAPSPDATPYVKIGDMIEEGQIVCIIEAMKVMNEIKAKVSGKLVEILVEAGHPVEFGAKIFRIQ